MLGNFKKLDDNNKVIGRFDGNLSIDSIDGIYIHNTDTNDYLILSGCKIQTVAEDNLLLILGFREQSTEEELEEITYTQEQYEFEPKGYKI